MALVFVVDQNFLRSEELEALASKPSSKFVILDEALIEMCKTPQWEDTLRRSLRILASRPARVVAGRSMAELLKWEQENKRSVDGNLLNAEGTAFLRNVMEGIRSGADSSKLVLMRENMAETQREMQQIHFDHEENKKGLVELVNTAESTEPDLAADLRKNTLTRNERLSALKALGSQLTGPFIERAGFKAFEARRMVRQRSAWLRFGLVRLWYAFDWLAQQGIEGIAAPKTTNEKMDYRYIVPGTFFSGGLLTRETQMNRCFADMAYLLRRWDDL